MVKLSGNMYLMKRKDVYYFKRSIPLDLQSVLGKVSKFSLQTKDLLVARERRNLEAVKIDQLRVSGGWGFNAKWLPIRSD